MYFNYILLKKKLVYISQFNKSHLLLTNFYWNILSSLKRVSYKILKKMNSHFLPLIINLTLKIIHKLNNYNDNDRLHLLITWHVPSLGPSPCPQVILLNAYPSICERNHYSDFKDDMLWHRDVEWFVQSHTVDKKCNVDSPILSGSWAHWIKCAGCYDIEITFFNTVSWNLH